MKHNIKITLILLAMFFATQMIGLLVINAYSDNELPYGMQPPEIQPSLSLTSIIISMIIAISLVFILMKIKAALFLKLWFFFVVILALSITFNSALQKISFSPYLALVIALPLAFYKIFRQNILVHNLTELLIYPGIASVFVPILNLWTAVFFLLLISVYDIYAVWHSQFMQKMAKFQINKLKIFTGFFLPYADKKTRAKIRFLKQKYKASIPEKIARKHNLKIHLAILGGGDVVFPIILAGVALRSWGFIPAITISVFATLSLFLLFLFARKGKFYPAMPFLTAGCLLGLLVAWLI